MNEIDVVITWVDGNDPAWRAARTAYETSIGETPSLSEDVRFRDWENLQYLFRGIEEFMPWVRKVHLITWGHVPAWLNLNHPKLVIDRHEDFIPTKYLPTFNSNAIEWNMHRIKDLTEQFIYFNDDMFVIRPTKPEDFFKDGKVMDLASVSPQPIYRDSVMNIELNNMKIINDYFSVEDIKKNKNWAKIGKSRQYAIRTLLFTRFQSILGVFQPHVAYTFFKSTYEKLWELEEKELDATCMHHKRSEQDVNLWLARSWQLCEGRFLPRDYRFGKLISAGDYEALEAAMKNTRCHLICINDDASVVDYEATKARVNDALESVLPKASMYEK